MAVPNARRELEMALRRSADAGNIARDEVSFRLAKGTAPLWQTPPSWANDAVARTEQFRKHARNMRIPEEAATSFADSSAAVVAVPGAPRTAMAGHAPGSA
jgi:hypothetical protein